MTPIMDIPCSPGPWFVGEPDTFNPSIFIRAKDGVLVARSTMELQFTYPLQYRTTAEMLSNAYLIAAAPDMYLALQALDNWLYEVMQSKATGDGAYSQDELAKMRDSADVLAQSALKKARGE